MTEGGIHHITAICGPARRNLAFHTVVLGLRLVKRTVNFDDPGKWHLYYGDELGRPGTVLTFFPWEQAERGRLGIGEVQETVFRIPLAALGFWLHRLTAHSVPYEKPARRFGETVLSFRDPDGMRLALAALPGIDDSPAWTTEDIPAECALRGFHGARLLLGAAAPTGAILTDVLGFTEVGREGAVTRYRAGTGGVGSLVDLHEAGGFPRGEQGAGSVHHIAFRAPDDAAQAAMAERLVTAHGLRPTPQRDRFYFRSIYFREPGGVLFEIATDTPGFTQDEPAGALGRALRLPPALEPQRARIEAALPPLGDEEDGGEDAGPATAAAAGTPPLSAPATLSFVHRYEPGAAGRPPLLLLHGSGADEHDLVPLGRLVAPGSALVAPRGKVMEGGAIRYFRRPQQGVFDEAEAIDRAHELAGFVAEARAAYGLPAPIALGLSNGANIAALVLMLHPGTLAGAVLLRAMPVILDPPAAPLAGTPVLMLAGSEDPIVPVSGAVRLAETLRAAGAALDFHMLPAGHGLTERDHPLMAEFIARQLGAAPAGPTPP